MKLYLVCYDVADPRWLRRTAKIVEAYGRRVQKSVFECRLTLSQLKKLFEELQHVMNAKEDHVLAYALPFAAVPEGLGLAADWMVPDVETVVA
ncbi:MAG: CRISPR-associated endonuclease Cas2 [Verrucomicrobiota bacterium]